MLVRLASRSLSSMSILVWGRSHWCPWPTKLSPMPPSILVVHTRGHNPGPPLCCGAKLGEGHHLAGVYGDVTLKGKLELVRLSLINIHV